MLRHGDSGPLTCYNRQPSSPAASLGIATAKNSPLGNASFAAYGRDGCNSDSPSRPNQPRITDLVSNLKSSLQSKLPHLPRGIANGASQEGQRNPQPDPVGIHPCRLSLSLSLTLPTPNRTPVRGPPSSPKDSPGRVAGASMRCLVRFQHFFLQVSLPPPRPFQLANRPNDRRPTSPDGAVGSLSFAASIG